MSRFVFYLVMFLSQVGISASEELPNILARLAELETRQEKLESSMQDGNVPASGETKSYNDDLSTLVAEVRKLQAQVRALEGDRHPRSHELDREFSQKPPASLGKDSDDNTDDEMSMDDILAGLDRGNEKSTPEKSLKTNDFEAKYNEGVGLLKKGDCKGAITTFKSCLDMFPESRKEGRLHYQLGCAYKKCEKFSEAKKSFIHVYKSEPNGTLTPQALLQLAQIFIAEGDNKKACTILKKGIQSKYKEFAQQEREAINSALQEAKCDPLNAKK